MKQNEVCHSTVLIGSTAIHQQKPDLITRGPNDVDVLALRPPTNNDDWVDGRGIVDVYCFREPIASLSELYTLKVSHTPWVITGLADWYKHLEDIQVLGEQPNVELIPELHDAAYKEWEKRKGRKNVNLNESKEKFFNNSVERFYVHDSVHEAVALGLEPAYKAILRDGHDVAVDHNKFLNLDRFTKQRLVYEEVMVLSLERDLIPSWEQTRETPDQYAMEASYAKQLRLLVTQYSKGWWTTWIIQNFFQVYRPTLNYWEMFWDNPKKERLEANHG